MMENSYLRQLSCILLASATGAFSSDLCNIEYGTCLEGTRLDFEPIPEKLTHDNCDNYPDLRWYCYINNGPRQFSFEITPARVYEESYDLFKASGYMHIATKFKILEGVMELAAFRDLSDSYTFNLSYQVDYDGFDPLFVKSAHYAYRASITLECDGRVIAQQPPFVGDQPGGWGGIDTQQETFSASFENIDSDQCNESITAVFTYEGQKLRIKKFSLAMLNESN